MSPNLSSPSPSSPPLLLKVGRVSSSERRGSCGRLSITLGPPTGAAYYLILHNSANTGARIEGDIPFITSDNN
jgi:hypothetical protein